MHFNWQNFSGVSELLSFPSQFLVKNAKITFFEKKGFECRFYRIEEQVVTNLSSRLGKHQTFVFFLRVDFQCFFFFKISHF